MSRRVAILNRKGGVGKTAISANLAHALAIAGRKVALVDLDPQGHLATSFGYQNNQAGMDSVLLDGESLNSVRLSVREGIDLYPAGKRLIEVEQLRHDGLAAGKKFREAAVDAFSGYDFVVVDCPPSAGMLMSNALLSVDEVISPVTGDYLALEGLSCIARALQHLRQSLNLVIKHWVALSRINVRRRINEDIFFKVKHYFPRAVLPTVIRESAVLAECPGYGQTIFEYRANCRSAREFVAFADDVLLQRAIQ